MRLTRSRVLAAVEKRKQPAIASGRGGSSGSICFRSLLKRTNARQRCGKVIRLEHVRLGLKVARGEDEMLGNNGKLVEHEEMGRAHVGDEEAWERVVRKRVKLLLGAGRLDC